MRKQIAAANWKMNLTFQQGERLLDDILNVDIKLKEHQQTVFAVPFPYLLMARSEGGRTTQLLCGSTELLSSQKWGFYRRSFSAEMLHSLGCSIL